MFEGLNSLASFDDLQLKKRKIVVLLIIPISKYKNNAKKITYKNEILFKKQSLKKYFSNIEVLHRRWKK